MVRELEADYLHQVPWGKKQGEHEADTVKCFGERLSPMIWRLYNLWLLVGVVVFALLFVHLPVLARAVSPPCPPGELNRSLHLHGFLLK